MSFNINEAKKLLINYKPQYFEYGRSSKILSVAMLATAPDPLFADTLYIASTPDELGRLFPFSGFNLVACFPLESVPFDFYEFCRTKEFDTILLDSTPSPLEIFHLLSTGLKETTILARFSEDLLNLLYHDSTVQNIVDLAYEYLGNPLCVFDAGLHLIASRCDPQNVDDNTARIIKIGHLDKEDIKMMNYENMHEKVKKSTAPILVQNKKYKGNRIISLINTKKNIGEFGIVEVERPFREIDFKLAEILRNSLDLQMKKDEFIQHTKGFNYEYFLRDMLDGKYVMKTDINKRLSYLDKEFSEPIYCLVVETARTPGVVATNFIRSGFETLFNGISSIVYDEQVVIIISGRNKTYLSEDEVAIIEKHCENNELYCGMSNSFKSITRLPEYYKQAQRAIQIGAVDNNSAGLFVYQNYFLKHVAGTFLQKENADTFCCPQMGVLIEYDKTKCKELAKTLYMYLLYGNANAAASAMFIHRNTMLYRMSLINELVTIDYKDALLRQYLILSYEMISYV